MSTLKRIALLTVVGSLVLAAGAQAAQVISPVAVQRAVTFWQPYSPTPVCPDGVVIHQVWRYSNDNVAGTVPSDSYSRREDGTLQPNCNVYVAPQFRGLTRPMQCAFVARSLGTSWFGLPPTTDRRNVMYGGGWIVPRACGA